LNGNAQGKPFRLVAFCGLAGSGKSTCSEFLEREWGYHIVKFAAPIKQMLRALGLTDDHIEGDLKELPTELLAGNSPRHAMQTLGTEWGRELMGRDFWADMWKHTAKTILNANGKVVVDDCRFPNELSVVKELGGVAVRIMRPRLQPMWAHESEKHVLPTDLQLLNDGGRDHLLTQLCRELGLRRGE